jgi:hypothetical protein
MRESSKWLDLRKIIQARMTPWILAGKAVLENRGGLCHYVPDKRGYSFCTEVLPTVINRMAVKRWKQNTILLPTRSMFLKYGC